MSTSHQLPPNLQFVARNLALQFFRGEISSAEASREFSRIANSGWHGEPYNALMAEFDAHVARLIADSMKFEPTSDLEG